MLIHLSIRQFAVVESLDLDFQTGMTVLTGETGAGKSILIDALQLALGERADSSVIRNNATQAEISALFDLSKLPNTYIWLQEHDLDAEGECILRRVISQDGRSRAFINGKSVTLTQVRELGEQLLDIHGQHQHQSLLKTEKQRLLLDEYGNYPELLEQVRTTALKVLQLRKELQKLKDLQGQQDKLALLEFQIEELQGLNLADNELMLLEAEHKELVHAEQWLESCQEAINVLKDGNPQDVITSLYQVLITIRELKKNTHRLNNCVDIIQSAAIQCEEAAMELIDFRETLSIDPQRLSIVEQRLSQIHSAARKYKIQPDLLKDHISQLEKEILVLQNLQSHLLKIKEQIAEAENAYQQSASALSQARQKTGLDLQTEMVKLLKTLEMPHANFRIEFSPKAKEQVNIHGFDDIEFLVSTNPGLALQPLRKIASGGELSRISLAIQVISSEKMTTPTLIFDEVDAGISGKTADTVGKLLKKLSKGPQVLCVTHLPQIACMGHQHYKVEKQQSSKMTTTIITPLEGESRVQELARMLGGSLVTQHALLHAKEMLEPV